MALGYSASISPGLGESGGDFADTNFSGNVDDLVAAANYLKENYAAPRPDYWALPRWGSGYFCSTAKSLPSKP